LVSFFLNTVKRLKKRD